MKLNLKLKPLGTTALLALSALAASSSMGTAHAGVLILDFTFQAALVSGPDTAGMNGATLSFEITANQATYATGDDGNPGGFPLLTPSSVTLTVTDSSVAANNGVFSITPNDFVFGVTPNDHGDPNATLLDEYVVGGGVSPSDFQFGPNSVPVHSLSFNAPPIANPAPGDAVKASDFNGLVLYDLRFNIGAADFHGEGGTVVQATMVPEPTAYAVVAGVALLAFAGWRRRAPRA